MDALLCDFNSLLQTARCEGNDKLKCRHKGIRALPENFQDVHNAILLLPRDNAKQNCS
jgi:hypothetical protein